MVITSETQVSTQDQVFSVESQFQQEVKMRRHAKVAAPGSFEVTVPPHLIKNIMRRLGLKDLDDVADRVQAVWHYDGQRGAYLAFEEIPEPAK
jgi:hypothetical protein